MRYEVFVEETRGFTYVIDAENESDALFQAQERYDRGEEGDPLGSEWATVNEMAAFMVEK